MHPTSLKLLHTSDVHIGADYYRKEALNGLRIAIEVAVLESVDAVLIAGDLFDHAKVSVAEVGEVFRILAVAQVPVVVLPGNHDTLLLSNWASFNSRYSDVHVIHSAEGEVVKLDKLGLTVWGKPVYEHTPAFRPMQVLPPKPDDGWYVAMAHGMVTFGHSLLDPSSPISPKDLEQADCDYIALGHVHVFRDVTQGGPPAFYCGAPSGVDQGSVALVNLHQDEGVSVTPLWL